ncbi:hypothetical protein BK718_01260 [Bacillus thuringiensis serovar andalousiensis]|uniref:Apea-like HEPN domain-containing protein n=1 Tax=Bacillus thuringiensis TaxID=1428 RepID=A0A9X6Q389_BACTU|nr:MULTISPECIES: HEPN domain-containing protein [Bacillus cereus group]MDA2611342.1 HEPN domain-containing protein [Bacillus cereus]MEB8556371.1 HEPN domain-containing protein [Bacillus cereus]MEB8725309.1 HEPN domain-containing protein [Bacillus cereus]MEB8820218.1 HEPN domain-containing protein [Bacillus cereus]MEB8972293.1 HEPN domain-containing protein [Bacillus cereus]
MESKPLRVEYLIIVDTKNSFCSNEEAFNNLLKSNSDISIEGEKLRYNQVEVNYKVHTNRLENGNQRYFHIEFRFDDLSMIEDFEDALRAVRDLLHKTNNKPQILWDDISFYYSNKAYPLIYEVENLMRKLITKFMLTNVGLGWAKENVPEEVKKSVRESKDETPDYLYKTDFIQLKDFLFEKYSPLSINKLIEKLRSTKDLSELTLKELKIFVPDSNWEKYFSELVECDDRYLSKRWERLYKLRNSVAHNRGLSRNDYNEVVKYCEEVGQTIQKAINSLDQISLSESDKEIVAENADFRAGGLELGFLHNFENLEKILTDRVKGVGLGHIIRSYSNFLEMMYDLYNKDDNFPLQFQQIEEILWVRSEILFMKSENFNESTASLITPAKLKYAFEILENLMSYLQESEFLIDNLIEVLSNK